MKVLAVGDIHTKMWIIDLVEKVLDDYDAVVFVGDYADNWEASALDSINTWVRLWYLQQKHGNKVKAVLGNHDYAYLYSEYCTGHNDMTEVWLNVPENKFLKKWLYSLPVTLEIDDVTYAHAGIDERWNGTGMWEDTSPVWVRPEWAQYKKIKQVVGHTPQKTVTEVEPDIWVIDTFSQYPNGTSIGDGSMLVITDGEKFEKIKLDRAAD